MRIVGVVRKVDGLGRIVIPKEYRNSLKLNTHDPVEVLLMDNGVLIKKTGDSCALCGGEENLIEFENRLICYTCLDRIKNM